MAHFHLFIILIHVPCKYPGQLPPSHFTFHFYAFNSKSLYTIQCELISAKSKHIHIIIQNLEKQTQIIYLFFFYIVRNLKPRFDLFFLFSRKMMMMMMRRMTPSIQTWLFYIILIEWMCIYIYLCECEYVWTDYIQTIIHIY